MPRVSASSAAFKVTTSLSLAHFRILVSDVSCRVSAASPRQIRPHVDTERHVPITSVRLELVVHELERDQRDVRVVHRLQGLSGSVHRTD